jgi:hypothetical protein
MQQFFDTIQDISGNALVGATVTVTLYPSGAASIYSDNGLTVIGSSIVTADSTGQVSFFAADGAYILVYKNAGGTTIKTRSPVALFDGAGAISYADTGTLNAYATTDSRLEKALRVGLRSYLIAGSSNNNAATYAYNGLTPKPIRSALSVALVGGEIVTGAIVPMEYDGTYWRML